MCSEIGFGGGCHWCTEAVFASLKGVTDLSQGYIGSDPPDDGWSEAVRMSYDPDVIPLAILIGIHLRTHSSTSDHRLRGKYRSAVYVFTKDQSTAARAVLGDLQAGYSEPIVTRVLPFRAFRSSDSRFQRYFETNAGGPFCTRYIAPKLDRLRKEYAEHLQGSR